jgi:hypothetical protein
MNVPLAAHAVSAASVPSEISFQISLLRLVYAQEPAQQLAELEHLMEPVRATALPV